MDRTPRNTSFRATGARRRVTVAGTLLPHGYLHEWAGWTELRDGEIVLHVVPRRPPRGQLVTGGPCYFEARIRDVPPGRHTVRVRVLMGDEPLPDTPPAHPERVVRGVLVR